MVSLFTKLFAKQMTELDLSLKEMAKELGIFSEDLQTGVIDDNENEFEPLELHTIDPNPPKYTYPSSHYFNCVATGSSLAGRTSYFWGEAGPSIFAMPTVRVSTGQPSKSLSKSFTLNLPNVLLLPAPKTEKRLLLPLKSTRPKYQIFSVNFRDFTWHTTEKNDKHLMFKVIGMATKRGIKDAVYLVGKDSHTGINYLLRCPPKYLRATIYDCISWCVNVNDLTDYIEI